MYGLGNSSSRSWVWAHFAGSQTRCVTCARNRALPGPRRRGIGKQSGPTATPAFEPAFELSRALPALLSSSASKYFFQRLLRASTGRAAAPSSTTSTPTSLQHERLTPLSYHDDSWLRREGAYYTVQGEPWITLPGTHPEGWCRRRRQGSLGLTGAWQGLEGPGQSARGRDGR